MFIEKISEWKYLVTPGLKGKRRRRYTVIKRKDGTFFCDCRSYRFTTVICKHIQAVVDAECAQYLAMMRHR